MKYKIEIWQFRIVSETYESNHIKDILAWYRLNWSGIYDAGDCCFYVYDNFVEMSFDELFALGFYD